MRSALFTQYRIPPLTWVRVYPPGLLQQSPHLTALIVQEPQVVVQVALQAADAWGAAVPELLPTPLRCPNRPSFLLSKSGVGPRHLNEHMHAYIS